MIRSSELIAEFRRMAAERWAYAWGAARDGCVDCSGAFVVAFRRLNGKRLPHGSNSLYRTCIGKPSKTPRAGYAAFKIRQDGREPERFRGDGIGNVYHIGLVDADGAHVLNAKSEKAGFCRDSAAGWVCFAPLNGVRYEEEENESMKDGEHQESGQTSGNTAERKARVRTKGGHLHLRRGRGLGYASLALIPNGTQVRVTAEADGSGWAGVQWGTLSGYVKASYLETEADA